MFRTMHYRYINFLQRRIFMSEHLFPLNISNSNQNQSIIMHGSTSNNQNDLKYGATVPTHKTEGISSGNVDYWKNSADLNGIINKLITGSNNTDQSSVPKSLSEQIAYRAEAETSNDETYHVIGHRSPPGSSQTITDNGGGGAPNDSGAGGGGGSGGGGGDGLSSNKNIVNGPNGTKWDYSKSIPLTETQIATANSILEFAQQNGATRYEALIMINEAVVESSLGTLLHNSGSTATGIFQYTVGTWAENHGDLDINSNQDQMTAMLEDINHYAIHYGELEVKGQTPQNSDGSDMTLQEMTQCDHRWGNNVTNFSQRDISAAMKKINEWAIDVGTEGFSQ